MNNRLLALELYNRYNTITRTRNCFLYTKKGIRLTDLYQQNGRAILGWHGNEAFTYLKNFLCKGLTGTFITEDKSRLNKAVSELLNSERICFFFSNKDDALKFCLKISPENTNTYKPWNTQELNWSNIDCVLIEPPLPWTDSIYIAAILQSKADSTFIEKAYNTDLFNKTISLPFALQAAISRAIYNLILALQTREEKDWFIYDTILTKYWTRKGPYLYPKIPEDKYDDFICHCLECEIVINPSYNSPSIVPFGADKGVFTKLKNHPFNF